MCEHITGGVNIYSYEFVSLLAPMWIFLCVCICDIKSSTSKKPYHVSGFSQLDVLQGLFQAFVLPDNSSISAILDWALKMNLLNNSSINSTLNWVLKLNLVLQKIFHPNMPNMSFYWAILIWCMLHLEEHFSGKIIQKLLCHLQR